MRGLIKLPCFPVRHANTPVRSRFARKITLMQPVARREFKEEGHRRTFEMSVWRLGMAPCVDVRHDNAALRINIIAVETGVMIDVLAQNTEAANRRPMSLPPARNTGGRNERFPSIKIGLLRMQAHHDRGAAGMPLRHVRLEHFGQRVASTQACEQAAKQEKPCKSIDH